MTILFYIMTFLAFACFVFLFILIRITIKARRRAAEEFYYSEYDVACAGSYERGVPATTTAFSDVNNDFYDYKGMRIPVDDFYRFIVHGNSMSLCGISYGDLIMVGKKFEADTLSDKMPKIVVVKRRNVTEGEAGYKVRRTWLSTTVEAMLNENVFSSVLSLPGFTELVNSPQSPGLKALIEDFNDTRLTRYLQDYPGAGSPESPYHKVILSTTLDTATGRIHFSVHPLCNVVGTVAHIFSVTEIN